MEDEINVMRDRLREELSIKLRFHFKMFSTRKAKAAKKKKTAAGKGSNVKGKKSLRNTTTKKVLPIL